MRFVDSVQEKTFSFFFTRLIQNVKKKRIRPFCVDEQGLWFETKYGFSVYSNLKDRILELDVNPAWEEMESFFIIRNLKEGDVFVDVGANIGYFSLLAAKHKAGKVLAIEPFPKTYNMLNMNIKHNLFGNIIEPFNIALGSEEHIAKFVTSLGPKNHVEYEVDKMQVNLPTVDVKVIKLDSLLKKRKEINKIDFIKVDIEGYEYNFLLGARKTIEAFKPMIMIEIEEHRLAKYNVTAEKISNFMNDLGYKYLSVSEDSITKGNVYKEDLNRGRDFIFYTCDHSPIY
ncbi:MAG TPA: FkbM family methyltransferase [Planctomycetes bacterium]|nr:FkbM family methyltransferase [Planctomycetota bacterium]